MNLCEKVIGVFAGLIDMLSDLRILKSGSGFPGGS